MSSRQERTSLRILTLTLYLSDTRVGYTRQQLGEMVAGYENLSEATFQRTFERDLADLREMGLKIELVGEWPDYRYRAAQSRKCSDVTLSSKQLDLLQRATHMWGSLPPAELARLHLKLASRLAPGEGFVNSPNVRGQLEGAEHIAVLLEAISLRQPVSFEYHSRRGLESRDVAPHSLLSRGTALYLSGYDFNRDADRHFRLSRIKSKIKLVAEPDCYEIPEPGDARFDDNYQIRPVLLIQAGEAPLVEMRLEPLESPTGNAGSAPRTWQLRQGKAGDWGAWEQLVLHHATHVVPVAPAPFKAHLEHLLDAASVFVNADGVAAGGK